MKNVVATFNTEHSHDEDEELVPTTLLCWCCLGSWPNIHFIIDGGRVIFMLNGGGAV